MPRILTSYQKPPLGAMLGRSHPLARGLVGCWLFNEGAGVKAYDLSGNGNKGTLTGFDGTPTSGWNAAAVAFDGSNDKIIAPINPLYGAGTFTIRVKVKINVMANFKNIVGNRSFAGGVLGGISIMDCATTDYGLNANSVIIILGDMDPDAHNHVWGSPTNSVVAGILYDLVFVREPGVAPKIYINGEEKPTTYWNASPLNYGLTWPATDYGMGFGESANSYSTGFLNGSIDSIYMYRDRALSALEVAQLYASPYAMFDLGANFLDWRQAVRRSFGLDALLKKVLSKPASFDAYLSKAQAETSSIDSLLLKLAQEKAASFDSLLNKVDLVKSMSIDALLNEVGLTMDAGLDALLNSIGVSADASLDSLLIRIGLMKDAYLDSLLNEVGLTKTALVDALLTMYDLSASVSIDAFLQSAFQETAVIDALLVKGFTEESFIDALLNAISLEKTASMDAILYRPRRRQVLTKYDVYGIGSSGRFYPEPQPLTSWRRDKKETLS